MVKPSEPASGTREGGEVRWLIANMRAYWPRNLGAVICAALSTGMMLLDPLILGWVIDEFIKSPSASVPLIAAGLAVTGYQVRLWLGAASMTLAAGTYQHLVMDLRIRLLEHFDRLSLDYHESTSVGAKQFLLITCVDDIAVIGAEVIPKLVTAVIAGGAVIVFMSTISPRLAMVLLPVAGLYVLTTRYFRSQMRASSVAANDALDRMVQRTHENLSNVPQTQLLSQEAHMIRKATTVLSDVRRCQARRVRSEVKYLLANGAITATGMGTVLGYGGHLVRVGAMSLGELVVCYSYLARLADPITAIADAHTKFQKSIASIRRLREFLALVPSVASPARPLPVAPARAIRIECEHISFAYGDRRAISGLTFTVQQGERVGLTGRSGAGKSTAAKLMARLYDPESGTVAINGTDVKAVSLTQVRRLIHYMPQHAMLYTGTVEDNLRYGDPDASAADLRRAIELAHLEPVLGRMPRGLDERVGSDGGQLSGGERQRLAFARALLQRPRVLILDEATAFLDAEVERAIFDSLRQHLPDTTLILISHRLSALTWVDRHLLLEGGRLMASGSHAALHRESSVYRELYQPAADGRPVASLSTSA